MRKRISSQPQRESPSANTAWLDLEALALLRALSAESPYSRAAKLGDCLSARWLMKVHHSLATYHGGAADMNKRCAMWLPTFLQRGIHFFGRCPETTPRAHARRIVQIEPRLIENRVFRWGRCRSQRRARLPQHVL